MIPESASGHFHLDVGDAVACRDTDRVGRQPGDHVRNRRQDLRRAALAAGPDVWEVIARLRELEVSTEERIATLSEESELHHRLIRLAVDYAAEHPDEIRRRMDRNDEMVERSRKAAQQREALLA